MSFVVGERRRRLLYHSAVVVGRRWTVPLSAALAVPALWPGSFAIPAACWRLNTDTADYHAPDVVRTSAWSRALRSALRGPIGSGSRSA